MGRLRLFLILLAAASNRLDAAGCAQVTVVGAGMTCQDLIPVPGPGYDPRCGQGAHGVFDNTGGFVAAGSNFTSVVRTPAGLASAPQTIAIMLGGSQVSPDGFAFDSVNGRLRVYVTDQSSGFASWCFDLVGFAPMLEITQTYTPSPGGGSVRFQTPVHPEGLAAADHFDTYWGPLTKPLDFTQARGLRCNYPANAPHAGDVLTVADAVPTPAPGQAVYYVTAATYQGTTRFGRKSAAGHLSGRDPAALPDCTP